MIETTITFTEPTTCSDWLMHHGIDCLNWEDGFRQKFASYKATMLRWRVRQSEDRGVTSIVTLQFSDEESCLRFMLERM